MDSALSTLISPKSAAQSRVTDSAYAARGKYLEALNKAARAPLKFDSDKQLIRDDTWCAVKEALITADCSRLTIEAILLNANSKEYKDALNTIFKEIRVAGCQVNLTRVHITLFPATNSAQVRDLSGLDFSYANLHGAVVCAADMRGVDLTGALVTCTTMMNVDLRDANLSGTNMSGSTLISVNMKTGKSEKLNLSDCRFGGTQFPPGTKSSLN